MQEETTPQYHIVWRGGNISEVEVYRQPNTGAVEGLRRALQLGGGALLPACGGGGGESRGVLGQCALADVVLGEAVGVVAREGVATGAGAVRNVAISAHTRLQGRTPTESQTKPDMRAPELRTKQTTAKRIEFSSSSDKVASRKVFVRSIEITRGEGVTRVRAPCCGFCKSRRSRASWGGGSSSIGTPRTRARSKTRD
eukprot:164985-Prorocentrum_minimum.AAC.2